MRIDATMAARPRFDPANADRRFVVCAFDYMPSVLVEQVVERVSREAPGVCIDFLPPDGVERLERGEIDLLLFPRLHALHVHPFEVTLEDRYCCVVWSGGALAVSTLSAEGYFDAGHVATRLGPNATPDLDTWFRMSLGRQRRVEVTTYNFVSSARLVVGTQRIATVRMRLAQQLARSLPLKLLPAPFDIPRMVGVMQWHRYKSQDPALSWLRGVIREVATA